MKKILFVLLIGLTSCFYAEDDDLRTVPVTNNPNIVPNHGSGLPFSGAQGPY